ncbi:MAG TPA: DUF4142 domain-containing protein [Vicinamibacterales bacterium]|nr:DUF4142 domain-containing protein [Vicinamibacterales bacterium]
MSLSAGVTAAVVAVLSISTGCTNSRASDADSKRPSADGSVSTADQSFVENAVASGKLEVEHGKMAEAQTTNAALKQYAARLVSEHTAANEELAAMIERRHILINERPRPQERRGGVGAPNDATTTTKTDQPARGNPSPTGTSGAMGTVETTGQALDRERAGMTEPWMQATGAAFDEGFTAAQVKAHQDAIALFDQQTKIGSDSELKAFAAKQLPQLRDHLREAQELQRTLQKNP